MFETRKFRKTRFPQTRYLRTNLGKTLPPQGTPAYIKSPDQSGRFSPHAFHLERKIEVFAAEASQIHRNARSSGQLHANTLSASNHRNARSPDQLNTTTFSAPTPQVSRAGSPTFAKLVSLKRHACPPFKDTCSPEHEHVQCTTSPGTT